MLALLLHGCSFGLTTASDSAPKVDTSPTRIDSLDPVIGPLSGGTAVAITGAGFVGDVTVTFGGATADVTVVDSSTLAVTTPRVSREATVDVKVVSDNGADTAFAAFTFSATASGDDTGGGDDDTGSVDTDTDTDTDTTPSTAGMIVGYVTLDLTDIACPLCFGLAAGSPPTVAASAVFHAPTDGSWLDWLPAEDACAAVTETPLASTWLDAGSTVTLTTSGATVSLSAGTGSGGTSYAATGLVEANFVQGASWDVAATGGADIAAFSLTGALHTPLAFTSIEPSIITTENTGSAYGAGFVAGGTTITWAPTGTGDFVLVELESSSYGNSIVCRSADDGTITIPGTALTGWPVGTQLLVHITRYDVSEAVLDEPSLELVARYEVVGTGSVR